MTGQEWTMLVVVAGIFVVILLFRHFDKKKRAATGKGLFGGTSKTTTKLP